MAVEGPRIVLIRHGETEWSADGRHTGVTDIPLTEAGRRDGERLRARLAGRSFALVLTSPLRRARDTCELTGYGDVAQVEEDLREFDYGEYEGRTTVDIRRERPGWSVWRDGSPGGETPDQVGARVDRVFARMLEHGGDVAVFSHGHVLRVLAARWLGLPAAFGAHFVLGTAAVSELGYERELRAFLLWNDRSHL